MSRIVSNYRQEAIEAIKAVIKDHEGYAAHLRELAREANFQGLATVSSRYFGMAAGLDYGAKNLRRLLRKELGDDGRQGGIEEQAANAKSPYKQNHRPVRKIGRHNETAHSCSDSGETVLASSSSQD